MRNLWVDYLLSENPLFLRRMKELRGKINEEKILKFEWNFNFDFSLFNNNKKISFVLSLVFSDDDD